MCDDQVYPKRTPPKATKSPTSTAGHVAPSTSCGFWIAKRMLPFAREGYQCMLKIVSGCCSVSMWMIVLKRQSTSRYLYKNAPQSNPSPVSIRPDCKKLIAHEMPHACAWYGLVVRMQYDLGLPHLLSVQAAASFGAGWRRLRYGRTR